jgi:hypothetical protein
MSDKKITELPVITGADLEDTDELVVVDISADTTKSITLGEFKDALDTATGFVRITGDTMTGDLTVPNVDVTTNITVAGTVDGRDVAADGTKLDTVEASADVTDTANVTAAGALMDSEVTNLAQVKAFDSADYATAAQGTLADSAVQPNDSPTFAGLTTTADVLFGDNDKAIFGAANDLEIDADSLSSRIAATGFFEIVSPASILLGGAVAGVPNMIVDPASGTSFLDSLGSPIAIIPNSGLFNVEVNVDLDVTGTVDATAFVGDGSGLTGLPSGYTNADVDTHLNTSTAANGEVLSWTGTDYDWIAAGASGGGFYKGERGTVGSVNGAGDIFRINEQELNTSTTIDADENASATGPLTVATGVTLTVTAGGNLSIV